MGEGEAIKFAGDGGGGLGIGVVDADQFNFGHLGVDAGVETAHAAAADDGDGERSGEGTGHEGVVRGSRGNGNSKRCRKEWGNTEAWRARRGGEKRGKPETRNQKEI